MPIIATACALAPGYNYCADLINPAFTAPAPGTTKYPAVARSIQFYCTLPCELWLFTAEDAENRVDTPAYSGALPPGTILTLPLRDIKYRPGASKPISSLNVNVSSQGGILYVAIEYERYQD